MDGIVEIKSNAQLVKKSLKTKYFIQNIDKQDNKKCRFKGFRKGTKRFSSQKLH